MAPKSPRSKVSPMAIFIPCRLRSRNITGFSVVSVSDSKGGIFSPDPSEAEIRHWLEGNFCRCTGYAGIVRAVQAAAKAMRG